MQNCVDLLDYTRSQAEARLIDEHEFRPGHERPPYDQHLLLPTRQFSPCLTNALLEARKIVQNELEIAFHKLAIAMHECPDPKVFLHAQAGKDVAAFGH